MKTHRLIENSEEYNVYCNDYNNNVYYVNLKNHKVTRELGPAIIFNNGRKQYWLNDVCFPEIKSNKEWFQLKAELIIKDIIE